MQIIQAATKKGASSGTLFKITMKKLRIAANPSFITPSKQGYAEVKKETNDLFYIKYESET